MTTFRVLPPAGSTSATFVFPGNPNPRTVTASSGGYLDLGVSDAALLGANGWLNLMRSGTTAQRPTGSGAFGGNAGSLEGAYVGPGALYLDTTLGSVIVYDGQVWRNPATAAAV